MFMEPLYLFLHIPRTGGTHLEHSVGHFLDRTNDRYLKHYHWVGNHSEYQYMDADIPRLMHRTKEQQSQIKIITGHNIHCYSHRWLRGEREPRYVALVRDPLELLLSSFNYRHQRSKLQQNPEWFSLTPPNLSSRALTQMKTAEDYPDLLSYALESPFEINMQSRWLIKCFLRYENGSWLPHHDYVSGADTPVNEDVDDNTWPSWMFLNNFSAPYEQLLETILGQMYWIGLTERMDQDIPDFCNHIGVDYVPQEKHLNATNILPYWTMQDVLAQDGIEELKSMLSLDYRLVDMVKNHTRPF